MAARSAVHCGPRDSVNGGARVPNGGLGSVAFYRCRASTVAALRGDVSAAVALYHTAPRERGGRDGGPYGAGGGALGTYS